MDHWILVGWDVWWFVKYFAPPFLFLVSGTGGGFGHFVLFWIGMALYFAAVNP